MMELTIDGKVFEFNFGMGFLREINKKTAVPVDGLPDVKKNIGFSYYLAGVLSGDIEFLVDVLDMANKGRKARVTRALLDSYIDDADTDIDALFDTVIDFLKQSNATKKVTLDTIAEVEKEKANIRV